MRLICARFSTGTAVGTVRLATLPSLYGIMNIFYSKSLEGLTVRRSQSVETFFGRLDRTGWFDHACPLRSSCVQSFRKILNDRSQSQTSILSDCPPQHRASKHAMVLHAQGAFRPIPLQRPDPWIHGTLWQQAVVQPVQLHLSDIVSQERPLSEMVAVTGGQSDLKVTSHRRYGWETYWQDRLPALDVPSHLDVSHLASSGEDFWPTTEVIKAIFMGKRYEQIFRMTCSLLFTCFCIFRVIR